MRLISGDHITINKVYAYGWLQFLVKVSELWRDADYEINFTNMAWPKRLYWVGSGSRLMLLAFWLPGLLTCTCLAQGIASSFVWKYISLARVVSCQAYRSLILLLPASSIQI